MASIRSTRSAPVLLLTPSWGGADGLSLLSSQYAGALDTLTGSRVMVWALRSQAADQPRETAFQVKGFDGRRVALAQAAMAAALAARPPRLVVALHVNQLPIAAPLVLRGVPLVHVLVGIEAWRPLRGVRKQVLTRAAWRLAISRHTFDQFAEANPSLAPGGVTIVHPYTPSLCAPASLPVAEPPGFALIVGRVAAEERYKGHDALIDAWPRVERAAAGARLVCAGDGDDLPRLRQRVHTAGLTHAITFTGAVSPAALAALYRDCAFLALPSLREGFGFVFLEAMAAGRACLGAPGSAEEIIVSGETGLIADPRQPDALESAVSRLFNDRAARTKMGQAGCVRAHTVFGAARFSRELGDALAPWLSC